MTALAATALLVNPALLIATIYGVLFALLIWWARNDYLDFCRPVRAHVINATLIVGLTAGVVAGSWELVEKVAQQVESGTIRGRRMLMVLALYEVVPCALLVARYGVIDLGGRALARWPMAIGGWTAAAIVSGWLRLHAQLS